jgi:PLP dependent protein
LSFFIPHPSSLRPLSSSLPLVSPPQPLLYNARMVLQHLIERLEQVQERIWRASERAGRDPNAITLVAITKGHPVETIAAAYEFGLRDFGENRTAELLEKRAALDLPGARWHFVGHLQSRKARDLIGQTDLIHSVDRLSLAEELSKRAEAAGEVVTGLLQVNASGEETKGGWHIHHREGEAHFLREVEALLALPALRIVGLMTMAPFHLEAEQTRPTFATTRAMLHRLQEAYPEQGFNVLSMGMTNDFEIAIEEGATHIRVGTALFGPRS